MSTFSPESIAVARAIAIEQLTQEHGNLAVPCSRYGWDTESCAPVAHAVAVIVAFKTGEPCELDYCMGLVVNDHDDVEYLIRNYGAEYGFDVEELLS